MLAVMRDEQADVRRRDEMARAAAPYVYPRLAVAEPAHGDLDFVLLAERIKEYERGKAIHFSEGKVVEINRVQPGSRPYGDGDPDAPYATVTIAPLQKFHRGGRGCDRIRLSVRGAEWMVTSWMEPQRLLARAEYKQQVQAYREDQLITEFEVRTTQLLAAARLEAPKDLDVVIQLYDIDIELQRRGLVSSPAYNRAVLNADQRAWEIWKAQQQPMTIPAARQGSEVAAA